MCGRFVFQADAEQLQLAFHLDPIASPIAPSYNIAPTQPIQTVVQRAGHNVLETMRWGLIPVWAKEMSIGARLINARAETVAEKSSFKRPLKSSRCLIPADGFYEWQKSGSGKTPMFIHCKNPGPFAFAGLYDTWKSPAGETVLSCTIITTTANAMMQAIHARMPVILPNTTYATWLDPSNQDLAALTALLTPYPAEQMIAYPVSTLVNSPQNNSPECIRPLTAPPAEPPVMTLF